MQLQVAVLVALPLPGPAGHREPGWQLTDTSLCLPLVQAVTSWAPVSSEPTWWPERKAAWSPSGEPSNMLVNWLAVGALAYNALDPSCWLLHLPAV